MRGFTHRRQQRSWDTGRRVASVSDEPSNAASEYVRANIRALNRFELPAADLRSALTDDFVHQDRRHGPTFPTMDAELTAKAGASIWDTGAGRPRLTVHEILAVRGDRLAACKVEVDYGNGFLREFIHVLELDASLTLLQRTFDFDVDDVDRAIAELDRMESQADAS